MRKTPIYLASVGLAAFLLGCAGHHREFVWKETWVDGTPGTGFQVFKRFTLLTFDYPYDSSKPDEIVEHLEDSTLWRLGYQGTMVKEFRAAQYDLPSTNWSTQNYLYNLFYPADLENPDDYQLRAVILRFDRNGNEEFCKDVSGLFEDPLDFAELSRIEGDDYVVFNTWQEDKRTETLLELDCKPSNFYSVGRKLRTRLWRISYAFRTLPMFDNNT